MTKEQKNYESLLDNSRTTRILEGVSSLLDWDQETYMPSEAVGIRSEQMKVLAGLAHERRTSKKFSNALAKLIDIETGNLTATHLDPAQESALKTWRKDYIRSKALPVSFVEDFTKLTSQATDVWRHAKKENAFHKFAPFLERIVAMNRQKADLIGYKDHPYDSLMDIYEHDISTKEVSLVFKHLRESLVPLLKNITSRPAPDDSFLHGKFDRDQQLKFGHVLLKAMHYDLSKGRLDISTHPFSSACHPTDSRITTRIHPTSLMSNISAVMHECGHALYEMGLPIEHYGTPLGEPVSLGMHESQSRWWETRIGLSKPFWSHFLPLLKQHFKGQLDSVSLDSFYKAINKVEPSMIRVEADEVTYPFHVILRFELEVALIEGKLSVRDLPEAWNAKMQELLGITPKTYGEGCLQDIHWSMGAFGYFPTYALGTLYSSHLFQGFANKHSDWDTRIEKGELGFIKDWLHESVYRHGRRYTSKELLQKATGKPFSAEAFVKYLTDKYNQIK